MGKLSKGTAYEKYAFENEILDKNKEFIEKKAGTAKYNFSIGLNGEKYGVWFDYSVGKIYVSKDYIKDRAYHFALTLEDGRENSMFMSAGKKYNAWRIFVENIKMGNVRYENQKIKHEMQEFIRKII